MQTTMRVFNWIAQHPEATIQIVLLVWAIINVVWAQWPKPITPSGQKIWRTLHGVFGLIATHATTRGTFTWPSLLRAIVQKVFKLPAPDPFMDADGDGVPDHLEK